MDYVPLVLLALVLVGAAVVARSMARLKRAAVQALHEVRRIETEVQALREATAALPGADGDPPGPGPRAGSPSEGPAEP